MGSRAMQVNNGLSKSLDDTTMAKAPKTTTPPPPKNPFAALFGGGGKPAAKGKGKKKTVARGKTKVRAFPMEDFGISHLVTPSPQVGPMVGLRPVVSPAQVGPVPVKPMHQMPTLIRIP